MTSPLVLGAMMFGTTIDGLAMQASLNDGPQHLRNVICGAGRAKPTRKRTAVKIKPKARSAAN